MAFVNSVTADNPADPKSPAIRLSQKAQVSHSGSSEAGSKSVASSNEPARGFPLPKESETWSTVTEDRQLNLCAVPSLSRFEEYVDGAWVACKPGPNQSIFEPPSGYTTTRTERPRGRVAMWDGNDWIPQVDPPRHDWDASIRESKLSYAEWEKQYHCGPT